MFGALGRIASRRPWLVILAWLVFVVLVVALAPPFKATNDQADFLPRHYESIKAAELQQDAFPQDNTVGAIVVFDRKDGAKLTEDDQAQIAAVVQGLDGNLGKAFVSITAGQPSENGLVQLAVVGLDEDATGFDTQSFDAVKKLRKDLGEAVTGDLRYGVTGNAAASYDQQESGNKALLIVGLATILLILVLLAIIFRSVLICVMPIVVVALVSQVAIGLIATANELFDLKASQDIETILFVVLFGIGTDYILFFLFRYRERLREGEEKRPAVAHALERAGEAIASAGGAVIVAFMALVLSSLGIFRSIGPALAIAVAVTLLAALTLVPAVVTLLGRALFWPSKKYLVEPEAARFAAVGRSVGRHPGRYALASGGVLALLAIAALSFNPTFDLGSSGTSGTAESAVALKTLEKGFPAGATDPTQVLLRSTDGSPLDPDEVTAYQQALGELDGVAQVLPGETSEDGTVASYSVYLDGDPASDAAIAAVKGPIRQGAHEAAPDGTEALVGGTTSVFVDFQAAMNRDYRVVFPVAAIVIMIILALLLRSLVAPLYLMASVGLGFAATLGATSILFQNILGHSGLIFILPIYVYLFVVALGTDYNILMIARLREEARDGLEPRDAAAEAIKHAGPTIAAAGVILAGTFASLMLAGNSFFTSMGFALSFGITVSAFVMAMFFVPGFTSLIGHAAWWPGHGDEKQPDEPERELVSSG
jgi:putative drug exporter of the RND superfamily